MDDGRTGNFTSLIGFKANSLLTEFTIDDADLIIKGRQHRFKYRAKNIVGWGPYSDDAFVLAARVPDRSERPYFLTFATSTLSIVIPRCLDNGGAPVKFYELWVDAGDDYTSEFRQLTNYADNALIYQATQIKDGLLPGRTYRFISRTRNSVGYSEFSIYSYIAFGDVPTPPGIPVRILSTENSIKV